jgi:predicted Rdx family selenoprotein
MVSNKQHMFVSARGTGKRTGSWCAEDNGNPHPDGWCDECDKMARDRIDPDRDLGHSDRK